MAYVELKQGDTALHTPQNAQAKFLTADWASAFTSQRDEFDYWVDTVEGTIPDYLNGTLFRNGPGNFERGGQQYHHMLDGDGYISAFSFAGDNQVHFRSRYVRTREFVKEQKADRVLFRNTFGTQPLGGAATNAFNLRLKNPANTNVVEWGNRLLALWEAGPPYALDPWSLDTLRGSPDLLDGLLIDGIAPSTTGSDFLDQAINLGSAMTAHPHIVTGSDPKDKRMITWCWRSLLKPFGDADMSIGITEFGPDWQKLGGNSFVIKHCFFNPHDFAVTSGHHVFFQNELDFDMLPYLGGVKGPAQCIKFASKPMKVHVLPRSGRDHKVFETESTFLIHHANAFEDGDEIEVWSSGWGPEALAKLDHASGMLGSWKVVLAGDFTGIPFTTLWRHRINMVTGEVKRTAMVESQNMDHPRVNPLFYSRSTRYVYFNASQVADIPGEAGPPQVFVRFDTQTGKSQSWSPGPRCFCEELIFVPGPAGAAKEDDGVLLGMVFDGETQRSSLVVMDASDFTKGPLARIHLSHHLPHGLHGAYSDNYYGPPTDPYLP
ncbi:carotenoid oxygenase [Coccomyxa subellipsoidea C-169]|uniref:carotenoid 9,10-dioxygenase n=1 Tax=Coccomyxa subellipsoidea (strain C-169) TaxID=574566 RepID=I0YQ17_COCSC|nr:carotenoid oxygenase [Coccomyxa subellipsoidea C-169]EIE20486.1 carotenoid oxygenase [Coccomyxa subellipsoidea C-169]|eukprot:XP_005645030.1 carotenoid oxygenase [Coccomyxa subellipsoidea C-169]